MPDKSPYQSPYRQLVAWACNQLGLQLEKLLTTLL
ncbi:hypothetical protein HYPP_00143 [Hyphomicrobium sp. ghe19]|nr:hypothetical protein HYPP_00143 [Hyphomicrobium sp. ghe19]